MARAKRTARAEARRRHRQLTTEAAGAGLDDAELADEGATPGDRPSRQPAPSGERRDPNARPSLGTAFRMAYHPANVREDLVLLPKLLATRAFMLASLLVLGGAGIFLAYPNFTGGRFAWDLLVLPGSAIVPLFVAGFFAPRASYLIGFVIGLLQAVVYGALLPRYAASLVELGAAIPDDVLANEALRALASGPFAGLLFAAAAAWYRRFLALTSRRTQGRAQARGGQQRRTASR